MFNFRYLLLGLAFLSVAVHAQSQRFVLIEQQTNQSRGQITATYVDQFTKEVIVKKYSLPASEKSSVVQISLPNQIPSLNAIDVSFRKENPKGNINSNVYSSQTISDIQHWRDQLESNGIGRAKIATVTEVLGNDRALELIEKREGTKNDIAVYFDNNLKQLVTIELPKGSNVRTKLSSPSDLHLTDIKIDRLEAQTPGFFNSSLLQISKKLAGQGLKMKRDVYQPAFRKVSKDFEKFVPFLEKSKDNYLYRMSYSHELRKLHIEKLKKNGSIYEFVDESVYDLATEQGHRDGIRYLRRNDLEDGSSINQLVQSHADGCLWPSPGTSTIVLPGMSALMDRMHESYLEKSLSSEVLPTGQNNFSFEISLLEADKKARLNIELDGKGEVKDVTFASKMPEGYRIVKSENKGAHPGYVIEYLNGTEWKPMMGFVAENIVRYQGGAVDLDLAIYVVGKKNAPLEYDEFEKSIFKLNIRPQKRMTASSRITFKGKTAAVYPMGDRPEDSGGLKNFFMQIFYSKNARRKEIRDTVVEEVQKVLNDPEFKDVLSLQEIKAAADTVANRVGQRTNNFDANLAKLKVVAYEEAMKEYVHLIMLKLMKQMLPEEKESDLSKLLSGSETDFHRCLAKASANRNIKHAEECLAVFKTQAPIDLGIGVLQVKLKSAGIDTAKEMSEKEYYRCIDQYYRPMMRNQGEAAPAQEMVKACVMSTSMVVLDQLLKSEVQKQAQLVELSPGKKLSLSDDDLNKLHGETIACFEKEKLLTRGFPKIQTNPNALMGVDTDMFTKVLDHCMGHLKADVGERAVYQVLSLKINELAPMSEEQSKELISKVVEDSYKPCIKEMLASNLPVNPTLCTSEVMSSAVEKISIQLGAKEVGEAAVTSLMSTPQGQDIKKCFADNRKALISNRRHHVGDSDAKLDKFVKEQAPKDEEAIVGCLKKLVVLVSTKAPELMIEESIKKSPELSVIVLTDEDKKFLGTTIAQCMEKELKSAQNFQSLSTAMSESRNTCGVALLGSARAQKILFEPVVKKSLAELGLNKAEQDELAVSLMEMAAVEVKESKSTDEIMERMLGLKTKAADKVIDFVLVSKIKASLEGEPEDVNKRALEIKDKIRPRLFNDSDKLGDQLKDAMNGRGDELNVVIDRIKIKAVKLIAPEVIQEIGAGLVKDGLLQGQSQIDEMKVVASHSVEECFNSAKGTADEKMDLCLKKTEVDVTQKSAKLILASFLDTESINKYISKDQVNAIINKVTGEKLRLKAEDIAAKKGPEKKAAFENLKKMLKIETARALVPVLVPNMVNEILKVPNHFTSEQRAEFLLKRENAINLANKNVDACLKDFEKPNAPEVLFDECLNRMRFELTDAFIPLKMQDILSLVSSDPSFVADIVKDQSKVFRSCAQKVGFAISIDKFGIAMDRCVVSLISGAASQAVSKIAADKDLTKTQAEELSSYYACLEQKSNKALESEDISLGTTIDKVQQCLINKGLPPLIKGVVTKIEEVSGPSLTLRSKQALEKLAQTLDHIVSYKTKSGKELFLDLESVRSKEDRPAREKPWTGVVDLIKKFIPQVSQYIGGAVNYDNKALMNSFSKFEVDAQALIEKKDGYVDVQELNQLLVNSDMVDILIKGFIADQIRNELIPFFTKYGLDLSLISYLTSKEMIESLFSSKNPRGKAALDNLKKSWLLPILNNKNASFELPTKEIADIKAVLAQDTRLNGFSETILGAVLQKELDQKRAGIETGWTSVIAVPVAALWHGVQRKDFFWGNRFDGGRSDNLRYQPSGKKAISHFSTHILGPMMNGALSDAQMTKEKEKISELVEKAMHENSWP